MEKPEKIWADGLVYKVKEVNPDYTARSVAIKLDDFVAFAKKHVNERGWIEIDLKVGLSGKAYAELNQWKPPAENQSAGPRPPLRKEMDDEIPF